MTANLRALIHMSGLRLCTMAQWEIRRLFQLIRHEVFAVSPFLGSFLAPKCVPLGYCDEMGNRDGHCPIRPHKDAVLAAWADRAAGARAAGRSLPVVDAIARRTGPVMTIHLQFDRIAPGTEIGPHRHGAETLVYLAAGEIVFEHGPRLDRQTVVRAGDALYEAPAEYHLVRNESSIDALALLATVEVDPARPGDVLRTWEAEGEPVRRREEARVVDGPGVRMRVLVEPGDFGTDAFSLGEVAIEPGAGTGWHRHQRLEHVIVVLEGRGTARMGSLEETLEPLRGVRVEMGLPHAITNTGRMLLRYYVCSTPAADPLTDREEVNPPT